MAEKVVEIIHRHTVSDKYKDEEVGSNRVYPPTYRVRPVEAQVTELRKVFPSLGGCQEKLARRELPEGAEAWFAIPRWQALASTYNEAVEMMVGVLARSAGSQTASPASWARCIFARRSVPSWRRRFWPNSRRATTFWWWRAQAGMLHRGSSARRTRVAMAGNEFGLGVFSFGCMLLTHPERLSTGDTLMIDCGGDEYSVRGDYTFDRVPLFDFDMAGIEFSIFYEDRARNLWGTPTGFLYKTGIRDAGFAMVRP